MVSVSQGFLLLDVFFPSVFKQHIIDLIDRNFISSLLNSQFIVFFIFFYYSLSIYI